MRYKTESQLTFDLVEGSINKIEEAFKELLKLEESSEHNPATWSSDMEYFLHNLKSSLKISKENPHWSASSKQCGWQNDEDLQNG